MQRLGQTLYASLLLALCFVFTQARAEKIIIDADVGIDDAMAIMLAFSSPELEVLGIVSSFGNASIDNATRNARYLVDLMGSNTPVVRGTERPMHIPEGEPADFVHGANGLGNIDFDEPETPLVSGISGAEFILQQSRLYPGELTLVPVGRLTNLALALKLDPTLPERIKRVVLMGGAFKVEGNVTPVAEANIWGDPDAADAVFSAQWSVVALGLDVTTQITVNETHHEKLAKDNPPVGNFLQATSAFYLDFYRSIGVSDGYYLHDPSAILYLTHPDIFETVRAPVRVASEGLSLGHTIAAFGELHRSRGEWSGIPETTIALDVDEKKARKIYLQRLATLKLHTVAE